MSGQTVATTEPVPDRLRQWLAAAVRQEASDLHLVPHYPPMLRVHGLLVPIEEAELPADEVTRLLAAVCSPRNQQRFESQKNIDFSLDVELPGGRRRFRANYFLSGGQPGACFRVIPDSIPSFDWAGFPWEVAERLAHFRNGLVLVSGVAGSGKTTTLAMIIHLLNQEGGYRIITVEEPVEYLFPRMPGSLVTQREVGEDVASFADGLKYGLRQDPDVILVGEIRDQETAQMALSAAETGHLVFATLHTRDAKGAISRYADVFPQHVQADVRAQLALSLRAVISQHLLPGIRPGEKRELALEILYNTAPIASGIRLGKLESIDNNILTGRAQGMITLAESVKRLLAAGRITRATAERFD
ncbi:MAG: PilT/PilU family type 4a pilus ATPase [Pirellulaceae bacterium]|nr:PilT/PilU family type 4a pilus ATPase [Pirellulaceae bacterium]